MALPLAGAVVPIAANVIRLTGGVLGAGALGVGAAPAAAGAAAGAGLAATLLPLAAAVGAGVLLGVGLLALWNALNQRLTITPLSLVPLNPSTWPTAKPGQTLFYNWAWFAIGYFETQPSDKAYVDNVTFVPSVGDVRPNVFYEGLGLCRLFGPSGPVTGDIPSPGSLRLYAYRTSDGQPPQLPGTSNGYAPSRSPLVDLLGMPLAFVPPADPVAPTAPSPTPTRREDPKAPPFPGTPMPAPLTPIRAPGGVPSRPGPFPRPGQTPNPIREPVAPPAPATMPNRNPALPQQTTTATGTLVQPAPLPVPVTKPGSTFLPGGVELPDNGPPPTMKGVATELGKLERKLEISMAPEGPLSLLQQINRAIDQIENIKFLLDNLFPPEPYTFAAGAYELAPICDRDVVGELMPPRTAVWNGGEGEVVEIRRKIDALAELIQHHKDLKQPICSPRGNGNASNVTVHFESD